MIKLICCLNKKIYASKHFFLGLLPSFKTGYGALTFFLDKTNVLLALLRQNRPFVRVVRNARCKKIFLTQTAAAGYKVFTKMKSAFCNVDS